MSQITSAIDRLTPEQRTLLMQRLTAINGGMVETSIVALEEGIRRLWMSQGRWALNEWPAMYAAAVSAAQTTLYARTAGFIADYSTLALGAAVETVVATGGEAWLATAASPSAVAGEKRLMSHLAKGAAWEQATNQTGKYLSGVSARDMQSAQAGAANDQQNSVPRSQRASGYRKELSGAPCGWCVVTSDQLYQSSNMPAHNNDRCSMVPYHSSSDSEAWHPGQQAAIWQDKNLQYHDLVDLPPKDLAKLDIQTTFKESA